MNFPKVQVIDPLPVPLIGLYLTTLSLLLAKLGLAWFLVFEPTLQVRLIFLATVIGAAVAMGVSSLAVLQSRYGTAAARALGLVAAIVLSGFAFGWFGDWAADGSLSWGVAGVSMVAWLLLILSGWLNRLLPWQASHKQGPPDAVALALCSFSVILGTVDAWLPVLDSGIFVGNHTLLILSVGISGALLLAPFATGLVSSSEQLPRLAIRSVAILLVFGAAVAFIDVTPYYDAPHYMPYIGPANSVWHGGIPLLDVFSQYGQGYLVFLFAFWLFGETFASAALVHSMLITLYLSVFALVVRSVSRNTLVFVVMTILYFWFYFFYWGFPLNMTPSHGPLRYLPSLVMLLATLCAQKGRASSFLISLLLAGSWIWSIEAGVTCTGIALSHAAIFSTAESGTWLARIRRAGRAMAVNLGYCCLILAGLAAAFRLMTGTLPRYDLYFALITPYLTSSPVTASSDPFAIWAPVNYFTWEPGFFAWITFLAAGTAAVATVFTGLAGWVTFSDLWTRRILLLLITGLLMSPTLILNTTTASLVVVSLPFAAAAIGAVSRLAERRQPAEVIAAFFPTVLLLSVFLSAALRPTVPYTTLVGAKVSGDTALRRLGNTLSQFCDPIGNACRPERPSAGHCLKAIETDPMCRPNLAFAEIAQLVQSWRIGDRVLLFHKWQSIMQIKLKSRHPYPVSWTMVEGWSAPMVEYILQTPVSLEAGDILFVSRDSPLPRIDRLILQKILDNWPTELVDRTANFSVLRLTALKEQSKTTNR